MRRPELRVLATILVLGLLACGEQSPTRPSPAPDAVAAKLGGPAVQAQINGLINALFAPKDQGAIHTDFARIKNAVASGRTTEAETSIVAFVRTLLAASEGGVLQDPNGAQPPSIPDALRDLVNSVATFGGLPPPIPASNPFAGDGAVAVVGPAGGTVVSSSGFGGVGFPPGALPADVIVVVSRLPNPVVPGAGPLPTTLTQFPLFYDFSTSPQVAQFAVPVTVGICQLEVGDPFGPPTQAVADRLQLAHPDPANPGTVELLDRQLAAFINCNGVTLAQALDAESWTGKALAYLVRSGSRVLSLFRPSLAYAVHGGLGGRTTSFSPFAAVDPGVITPLHGQLVVGAGHGCLIETGGGTVCWGSDVFGELGDGTPFTPPTVSARAAVAGSPSFTTILARGQYNCGMTAAAATLCWGRNPSGSRLLSPPASGPDPYATISPARLTACGITTASIAVCWGLNQAGELGDGTMTPRLAPVPVLTAVPFTSIEASWTHSCALTSSGAAYCWGRGRLVGDGTTTGNQLTPVPVSGGHVFARLYSGGTHTCGLTSSNVAWCWGDNAAGQLGDGTTNNGATPVAVSGGHLFAMVAAGTTPNLAETSHTCAITTTGKAYCWGRNNEGQLGDGSTTNRLLPTPVLSTEVFVAIGAGDLFSCAMTPDRRVFCWGSDQLGQLGSGTLGTFSSTPVLVP